MVSAKEIKKQSTTPLVALADDPNCVILPIPRFTNIVCNLLGEED